MPVPTFKTNISPADLPAINVTRAREEIVETKATSGREGAASTNHVPHYPSIPTPGAAENGERICDAPSDPNKPAGVESVDKGA